MALKPVVVSNKTDEVPLTVGGKTFFVRVRHITRAHDEQLHTDAVVRKRDEQTLALVEKEDNDLYGLKFFHAAVIDCPSTPEEPAGWRGLTPEILAMLVELPEDYTPRLTKETRRVDGKDVEIDVVAFDAELAEFLWTYARVQLFQNPIYVHAQAVLITAQVRKEFLKGNSLGSSAA